MAMTYPIRWREGVELKTVTSMKIGGPATYFSKPANLDELREDIRLATESNLVWKVLGGGSNVVFADEGYPGLIIQPAFIDIRLLEAEEASQYHTADRSAGSARYAQEEREGRLELSHSGSDETGEEVFIEMGAAVPWGRAVMVSLQENLAGLHWYARIPSQVGGAVYNNIHAEKHLLGEVVAGVYALNPETGEEDYFPNETLAFNYDYSRFHTKKGIITRVIFALTKLSPAEIAKCKDLYLGWTKAKVLVQPSGPNCGSVFQNVAGELRPAESPLAAGWYVEEVGLKGVKQGTVQVYSKHANFIVHEGDGLQTDFIALIARIRQTVFDRYGFWLTPEVEIITAAGEVYTW